MYSGEISSNEVFSSFPLILVCMCEIALREAFRIRLPCLHNQINSRYERLSQPMPVYQQFHTPCELFSGRIIEAGVGGYLSMSASMSAIVRKGAA